jgi:hypothetical protein
MSVLFWRVDSLVREEIASRFLLMFVQGDGGVVLGMRLRDDGS